jgi:hypothetical protein
MTIDWGSFLMGFGMGLVVAGLVNLLTLHIDRTGR